MLQPSYVERASLSSGNGSSDRSKARSLAKATTPKRIGSYAEGHSLSRSSEDYCRSCTETVQLVQGKWKIHILCSIRSGPVRLGQLRRELRYASKKVLTENLRELGEAGLVVRRDLGGSVRHVEYDFDETMRPQIQAMLDHLADFGGKFGEPQKRSAKGLSK